MGFKSILFYVIFFLSVIAIFASLRRIKKMNLKRSWRILLTYISILIPFLGFIMVYTTKGEE